MIYLDNSATTFPKPQNVTLAVNRALREYGFNPGRGGYRQSVMTAQRIFEARSLIKDFFGMANEENVIFTGGCTQALNTVIKGVLHKGDHVVISSFEHNAVLRPLQRLKDSGMITYSVAEVVPGDDDRTLSNFRKAINAKTRLFVCTHASNVFGNILPTKRLCALAHHYGVLFCLDAAQTAGVLPINMQEDGYDFVCCAGHKYLYGPMGAGLLLIGEDRALDPLIEGGTGSESADARMPSYYPDRLEAGTLNVPGIFGLSAGVRFVKEQGIEQIYRKETRLITRLHERLNSIKGVTVYGKGEGIRSVPVLAFTLDKTDSEKAASMLGEKFGVAVRGGLHCAPLAHRAMGTIERGVVRVAPSVFTTEREIALFANAVERL